MKAVRGVEDVTAAAVVLVVEDSADPARGVDLGHTAVLATATRMDVEDLMEDHMVMDMVDLEVLVVAVAGAHGVVEACSAAASTLPS